MSPCGFHRLGLLFVVVGWSCAGCGAKSNMDGNGVSPGEPTNHPARPGSDDSASGPIEADLNPTSPQRDTEVDATGEPSAATSAETNGKPEGLAPTAVTPSVTIPDPPTLGQESTAPDEEPSSGLNAPCRLDADCDEDLFCRGDVGDCDGGGRCQQPSLWCSEIEALACGCDGRTYRSGCTAMSVGVNLSALEPCEGLDGGAVDVVEPCGPHATCQRRYLCDPRAVEKSTAFLTGTCRTPEEIGCDETLMLCGADLDWHSECEVVLQGIAVLEEEEPCETPESCTVDGVEYSHGEQVPSDDACNTCSCRDGDVLCTLVRC